MPKVRIYELAKQLNKNSKDILDELVRIGVKGKTHSSSIEPEIAEKISKAFSHPKETKAKREPSAKEAAINKGASVAREPSQPKPAEKKTPEPPAESAPLKKPPLTVLKKGKEPAKQEVPAIEIGEKEEM